VLSSIKNQNMAENVASAGIENLHIEGDNKA